MSPFMHDAVPTELVPGAEAHVVLTDAVVATVKTPSGGEIDLTFKEMRELMTSGEVTIERAKEPAA